MGIATKDRSPVNESDSRTEDGQTAQHGIPRRTSRRTFLGQVAAPALVSLAPWVVSRSALGLGKTTAPSERINLGFIGIGCMGQGHLAHLLTYDDVQVMAVCDVDTWRRENAQQVVETAYAARRTAGQYKGCAAYIDFRELLRARILMPS